MVLLLLTFLVGLNDAFPAPDDESSITLTDLQAVLNKKDAAIADLESIKQKQM